MSQALVTAEHIADLTGFTPAWVRKHARAGNIPGAYKLGGAWRFDKAKFLRWLERREQQPCQSTGGGKPTGYGFNGGDRKSDDRLRQLYGV